MNNPIHQLEEPERCEECNADGCYICEGRGGWPKGWYFWNEVWADRYGPYKSEEEAKNKCKEYAEQL